MSRLTRLAARKLPEMGRVAQRFPWAVLAALAFAAYFLFGLHRTPDWPETVRLWRIPAALTCALLWAIAAGLIAQARRLDVRTGHALALAGFLIIALLAVVADRIDLSAGPVLGALSLVVGLAPYLTRGARQGAFWLFNHNLWIGFLAAVVAASLSGLGLSAIVETLRYLFSVPISYEVHEKIWAVACGLIGPIYWLSVIPHDFEAEAVEGPQVEFTSRAVALVVKFILVPLVLAYAAILHAYAVKVGFAWDLPKGRLGWLTLSFGIVVALTVLLVYPTRASGGPLVAMFWRAWPWLMLAPLGLLLAAIGVRIAQYGLTAPRYVAALAAAWLAGIVVLQLSGLWSRDLRFIPGLLAGLLALAALGPWGAVGWPISNQAGAVVARLAAASLLVNGRLTASPEAVQKLARTDQIRIAGAIDYLASWRRLEVLRPLFAGDAKDPFAAKPAASGSQSTLAAQIRGRLQLTALVEPGRQQYLSFYVSQPGVVAIGAAARLIGPVSLYVREPKQTAAREVTGPQGKWSLAIMGTQVTVRDTASGRQAMFDLAPVLGRITVAPRALPEGSIVPSPPASVPEPIGLRPVSGDLRATLVLTNLSARGSETGAPIINSITFWLALTPDP